MLNLDIDTTEYDVAFQKLVMIDQHGFNISMDHIKEWTDKGYILVGIEGVGDKCAVVVLKRKKEKEQPYR